MECNAEIKLPGDGADVVEEPHFQNKMEKAAFWIKKLLEQGDMPSKEMYYRLSELGIGHKTAEETKKVLGIRSYRVMRQWYWGLKKDETGD